MYKRKESSLIKHLDFTVLDLVCIQLSYVFAYMLRHGRILPYDEPSYRTMGIVLVLIGIIVSFSTKNYSRILKRGYYRELVAVIEYVTFVILGAFVYMFMVQTSGVYSRITFGLIWCIDVALTWIVRVLYRKILRKRLLNKTGKRSVIIVTNAEKADEVVAVINRNRFEGIRLSGVIVVDADMEGQDIQGVPVVANYDDALDYIKSQWVDEVFLDVASDSVEERKLIDSVVDGCVEMGITLHHNLGRRSSFSTQVVENFAGYKVLSSSISVVSGGQLFMKRALDILGGIVGCVIMFIALIFVGPIIYIKSPGPIFFSQVRVGKNGRTFKIYKFRSMYMDAEERKKELMAQNKIQDGMMFKMDDDPRIIKGIGHFIRNYSIDELPQFWNILVGDMSLVGTRPPTVDEWDKYELHHRKRLAIKPGLTGMWQVSGRSNIVDFEKVVELDSKYIAEWSFLLDIKIILKTIKVVLCKEGSV